MYVYLVRHAEAVSKDVDPMRPLSKRGVEQAKKTGRFLKNMGIGVSSILHSGKKRAEETASLIASEIKHSFPLEKRKGLSPDDPVDGIMRELETKETDCLIVGHLPYLSLLSSALLCEQSRLFIDFAPAGAVCLEKAEERSGYILKWSVNPEIL